MVAASSSSFRHQINTAKGEIAVVLRKKWLRRNGFLCATSHRRMPDSTTPATKNNSLALVLNHYWILAAATAVQAMPTRNNLCAFILMRNYPLNLKHFHLHGWTWAFVCVCGDFKIFFASNFHTHYVCACDHSNVAAAVNYSGNN